jgi:hypothetical protein
MNKKAKLVRVKTRLLPNETFYRFMSENYVYYLKYNPATLEIEVFMVEYVAAMNDLDLSLERIRKSAETERIAQLDVEFDRSYMGMEEYVRACLKHYDPKMRYAAENLMIIFKHYGNIGKQAYRKELGSSANLLQDLRARSVDVATLALHQWMLAHEEAAAALALLLNTRTTEDAKQSDIRVSDARLRMEAVYQLVTDRIDAVINLKGKDFAGDFYAEYNAHATEYKTALAQHLGRIHKAEDEDDLPDSDPDDTEEPLPEE